MVQSSKNIISTIKPYYREPITNHMARKKVALKNFTTFKGKHLCWSLFLMKLQTPDWRTTVFTEHLQWLFLDWLSKSSNRSQLFYEKAVLINLTKFTGKHLLVCNTLMKYLTIILLTFLHFIYPKLVSVIAGESLISCHFPKGYLRSNHLEVFCK